MQEVEEWRDIPGTDGKYQASNWGRIRSFALSNHPARILKLQRDRGGYATVYVCYANGPRKNRKVHLLVLDAFVGQRPDGMFVNHIDFDRANNRLTNLEYVTPKENTAHSQERRTKALRESPNLVHYRGDDHWTRLHPEKRWRGESVHTAKIDANTASEIKRLMRKGMSIADTRAHLNLPYGIVYEVYRGRSWKHVL